jgi:hypothetical protein
MIVVPSGMRCETTVRDDGARRDHAVAVERLDPVVVFDAHLLGVLVADPHRRPAPEEGEHCQIILKLGVDGPLRVWREVLEDDLGFALLAAPYVAEVLRHAYRRAVGRQALAVLEHPLVVHVELLPSG